MGGDHGELRESVSSGRLSKGSMSKGVIIGDQTFPPTSAQGTWSLPKTRHRAALFRPALSDNAFVLASPHPLFPSI